MVSEFHMCTVYHSWQQDVDDVRSSWVVDGRGMLSPVIWDVSDAADVPLITKAYQEQFGDDFLLIRRTRAEEIVSSGRMVLTIRGSTEADDHMWDF
ncbi:hypothetical protein Dimus_018318 [Dionaea muscipula]